MELKDPRKYSGTVKFYSYDRGYGFIHVEEKPDIYFHITAFSKGYPPNLGDCVEYEIEITSRGVRAVNIHPIESYSTLKENDVIEIKKLEGFPCIKGGSMKGFYIAKHCYGWLSPGARTSLRVTANIAQGELIQIAHKRRANAIVNFYIHRENKREKIIFGRWKSTSLFWAEGQPVVLEPN